MCDRSCLATGPSGPSTYLRNIEIGKSKKTFKLSSANWQQERKIALYISREPPEGKKEKKSCYHYIISLKLTEE